MSRRADEFRKWLTRKGYRPRTVDKTVIDLESYIRDPQRVYQRGITLARYKDYERAVAFYKAFAEENGSSVRVATPPKGRRPEPPRRKRQKEAVSIDDSEWQRLRALVAHPHDGAMYTETRVLDVMLATGLRVADVLRVPSTMIESGLRRSDGLFTIELKGGKVRKYPVRGADREWRELFKATKLRFNVAEAVSGDPNPEANGAAYQRVRKVYKALCVRARVSGSTNLHRIRRTVAVRLLDRGVPLYDVQQLLGHSDSKTTQGYTDEWATKRMTDALRKNQD